MKKIAAYLIPVLACFAVGISASFFQASSIAEWYPTLTKPTLTPPNIVFPIAWSVLYLCMGLSLGRLIVRRQHKGIIRLWVLQLIANFLWSILFFTLRNPLAGFIDIVLLNILVGLYIFAAGAAGTALPPGSSYLTCSGRSSPPTSTDISCCTAPRRRLRRQFKPNL
jgi:tryptophan-rich sensory protein